MIRLEVNGRDESFQDADGDLPLLDVLHERLGLTGTKLGCGLGICRACTVAVRRAPSVALEPALACSVPLDWFADTRVLTVEGVAAGGAGLHPVQQAFLESFAFQCGYCTPGFVMAGVMLLDRARRDPIPPAGIEAAVEAAIGEHVCRCTGYAGYHAALERLLITGVAG
jgi:aerobic-type carbon monoxide dehydrogenase small subunit (CoxS/CutS family)